MSEANPFDDFVVESINVTSLAVNAEMVGARRAPLIAVQEHSCGVDTIGGVKGTLREMDRKTCRGD